MSNSKTSLLLALTLLLSVFLNACGAGNQAAGTTPTAAPTATTSPLVLTDALDREVVLAEIPQRIVSLAPSNTEILFAVGAGPQVVGRDEFSDYPEDALALPSVGGSFGEYNLEAIINLQPDLVLAAEINPPELIQSIADLGLAVYLLPNPSSLEELYENLETVAQISGHDAAQLVQDLRSRVSAVEEKVAPISSSPLVFYELDSTDPSAPYTAGPGTFVELLITKAGGRNLGSSLSGQWAQISVEDLIVQNPDIILLGDSAYGVTPEMVGQRPGWEQINAVLQDQVYPFDDDLVSRPGPRMVDGLEQLAQIFHPGVFE